MHHFYTADLMFHISLFFSLSIRAGRAEKGAVMIEIENCPRKVNDDENVERRCRARMKWGGLEAGR